MTTKVLGRGLSSLMSSRPVENQGPSMIHVNLLEPGKYQPRKIFDEDALQELSNSIRKSGIIQPILVRSIGGKYSIIAGERRWRAAQMCGLFEVPVIVKDIDDKTDLEYSIIENVQRKDLSPIEESEGYIKLANEFNYTQEQISKIVGKSRGHVTNMMRLNNLPEEIKSKVNEGILSMGHARTLIGLDTASALEVVDHIITKNLNVRQTENFVSKRKKYKELSEAGIELPKKISVEDKENKNYADLLSLQESISEMLGVEVIIKNYDNRGNVSLKFNNLTELDLILQKLSG